MAETKDTAAEAATSAEVRRHLVRALRADLVGPFSPNDDGATEILPLPPSRWYLTGFLAPQAARDPGDPTEEDELGAGEDEAEEGTAAEPEPKRKNYFPASLGMSVLLPAEGGGDAVEVTVRWADYVELEDEAGGETVDAATRRRRRRWKRMAHAPVQVTVALNPGTLAKGVPVPDSRGLALVGKLGLADAPGLPKGTRALSLFLVNRRELAGGPGGRDDEAFAFQVSMELRYAPGLVPRPNRRGEGSKDFDEQTADLQFRDRYEYAVGHGVSVEVDTSDDLVTTARTRWIPEATVHRVVPPPAIPGVETGMDALAGLDSADAVRAALAGLPAAYRDWLKEQAKIDPGTDGRRETARRLLDEAKRARQRIADGIERLAADPQVLAAFRLANRAMAEAARKRSPDRYKDDVPRWRLFQLAFVLLNLRGVADDGHRDRDTVELIFFPTGGGKTEAYLGLIAFALVLRRMRGASRPDGGYGLAVILRYTLRLLTLDQLGRAATLICALELMRRDDPATLGEVRFSLGLWVGKSATANTMGQIKEAITAFKNSTFPNAASPFPIPACPWCGKAFKKDHLVLKPNRTSPTEVVVACTDYTCDFAEARSREGLPVLFVDEQIYRELPSFLVATVDKFAMLPWRAEVGALFGRVQARSGRVFYGPASGGVDATATALPDGLHPPELIVQDELHLISGPLGTMVGLYESAIEALCTRRETDGAEVRPKIIASTATVRRAREQIRALYGRRDTAMFPPPGVDDSESFFATMDRKSEGRLYLGIAAQGRAMKGILLRVYQALLGGAQRCFEPGDEPPADPYMTVVGYFNSLRELGGMRRLVEDEIRTRVLDIEARRPEDLAGPHPWMRNRAIRSEPLELTSRESTFKISKAKHELGQPFAAGGVDVVLASNMISVGVDIDRLGLMVIAGQPKTTSEYIQASSRVGRDAGRPGLVVTVFNLHKPRDRSHYERFCAYHESFYRSVEATSVTPFSGPALERGFAGALVGLVRHDIPALTAPVGLRDLAAHRAAAEAEVERIAARAAAMPGLIGKEGDAMRERIAARGRSLLDAWQSVVDEAARTAAERCYSVFDLDKKGRALLYTIIDEDQPAPGSPDARFSAPTSMRDVEASVHLWLERGNLTPKA